MSGHTPPPLEGTLVPGLGPLFEALLGNATYDEWQKAEVWFKKRTDSTTEEDVLLIDAVRVVRLDD